MEKTLAILAAGIGSRYGGLKQMDPMGPSGEFIIDYSVYDALRAGFNKVVFIIRHDIEKDFRASIGARVEKRVATEYAFQELADLPSGLTPPPGRTKPWGTVQAVLTCSDKASRPFAVINADDYYGQESYGVLSRALDAIPPAGDEHCMIGFLLRNTLSDYGSVTRGISEATADGSLKHLVEINGIEKADGKARYPGKDGREGLLSGDELVSMNMWGFSPSIFAHFRRQFAQFLATSIREAKSELVLPNAVGELVSQGKASVKVIKSPGAWFGITNPQDKAEVAGRIGKLIAAGLYPRSLWE